jgi:hypothetical protein
MNAAQLSSTSEALVDRLQAIVTQLETAQLRVRAAERRADEAEGRARQAKQRLQARALAGPDVEVIGYLTEEQRTGLYAEHRAGVVPLDHDTHLRARQRTIQRKFPAGFNLVGTQLTLPQGPMPCANQS